MDSKIDFQKLKEQLIKDMNIDKKTMHVFGISTYVKRLTVKEFFEVLECAINNSQKK